MLEAKAYRQKARGQAPLDVDAELGGCSTTDARPGSDPALRAEVRDLVVARNAPPRPRRARSRWTSRRRSTASCATSRTSASSSGASAARQ